jgi:methylase of polypeptide subunit release factors
MISPVEEACNEARHPPQVHSPMTIAGAPTVGSDIDTVEALRSDWRAMMAAYLPDIDSALSVVFDAVELAVSRAPTLVLDLGGGPGLLVDQMLARWPSSSITMIDLDPVLLALARAALPPSVTTRSADLATPGGRRPSSPRSTSSSR